MPNLLDLCLGIQAHAERLHQAKIGAEGKIKQVMINLEDLKTLELQAIEANKEESIYLLEAEKAEAEYATFRESIMGRMMDAARAGESIDREEAGKLMELEVDRNLKIEKAKDAEKKAAQLKSHIAEKEKSTLNDLKGYSELQELDQKAKESAQHIEEMNLILTDLSVNEELINEQHPNNALKKLKEIVEIYRTNALAVNLEANEKIDIQTLRESIVKLPDVETIDSTALFSEICITIAYSSDRAKIDIPAQDTFVGDLTEY